MKAMEKSIFLSIMKQFYPLIILVFALGQKGCVPSEGGLTKSDSIPSQSFKDYWFDGNAEISSYQLKQSRYGALREGQAVLIYVTEDFHPNTQVKANQKTKKVKPVLKLNRQKKFLTGIYPYSVMTSSFTYIEWEPFLAKVSASLQEWCGHSYLQLNQRGQINIQSHSYFEGEADQKIGLSKNTMTEDELWNRVRLNPDKLPLGTFRLLPSLELIRLNHWPLKTVSVTAQLRNEGEVSTYEIDFESLGRTLSIHFQTQHPHQIEGWVDRSEKGEVYSSIANRVKTEKLPYWQLNKPGDERYRDSLKLVTHR